MPTGDGNMAPPSASSLLDHLRSTFDKLPNPRQVSLTVLASSPKRTTALFPYTHHPRCFQVDYLVTLGCDVESDSRPSIDQDGKTANLEQDKRAEEVKDTNGDKDQDKDKETKKDKETGETPHVLTTALSAHLYILPHQGTSILYISKLDSSGYPTTPLPLTRTFIVSILSYFLMEGSRPTPNIRIQLFARSQGQYLFPNSAEGPKKVLGGLGLCGWWKGVYEDVAASVTSLAASGNDSDGAKRGGVVKLGMVLPGYSPDEAKGMLGQRRPLPPGLEWTSTPPFYDSQITSSSSSSSSLASASASPSGKRPSLADWIPSLPDDPKARFLDDLVSDGAEDPTRRRNIMKSTVQDSTSSASVLAGSSSSSIQSHTSSGTGPPTSPNRKKDGHRARVHAEEEAERRFTHSTLERVTKEEYWERMGFRQECISGDVTGFFSLESTSVPGTAPGSGLGSSVEPSTSLDPPPHSPIPTSSKSEPVSRPGSASASASASGSGSAIHDPKPSRTSLPPSIVERVTAALVNTDFASYTSAIQHTAIWVKSVRSLVVDEIGEEGYRRCCGIVGAKAGSGSGVSGTSEGVRAKREEAPVTMLQVRKKKKV